MNRRAAAAVALVALAVLAGCTGGGIDRSRLDENVTYDWSRDAVVTIDVTGEQYRAVYNLTAVEKTEIELYTRSELSGEQPLSPAALTFRYPNGTVVGASAFTVEQSGDRTVVVPPADNGSMAFTGSIGVKSYYSPVFVEGSHEVILPEGMRVAAPLFGSVSPGGYTTDFEGGRVHIYWSSTPRGDIGIQYYLERDFYIYTGLVAALLLAAVGGVVYFRLQIRALERRRRESGLELED